ncbi:MAG: hypothetical protein F6I01_002180 [Aerococcus sanguinicola]
MIIDPQVAADIDSTVDKDEILALEHQIINYTNNHFHAMDYHPDTKRIEGNRITFEGANLFKVDDTVEVYELPYVAGFYHVTDVGDNWIELDNFIEQSPLHDMDLDQGAIYLLKWPPDVKSGVKKVMKYQKGAAEREGIKSKSVSRVTVTYSDDADKQNTIAGYPARLFDFLEPYMKPGWS